jgi:RHS repeat-associated protein
MNLSFDVENRLVAIDRKDKGAEQYGYNPGNLRIWKKLASGEEEIHFYGSGGRRLATYKLTRDNLGTPSLTLADSDIYFAGKLLSSKDKPVVLDRLGSVRAWIDSQSGVEQTKYYPFGEERQVSKNDRRKFGTYVRDDFSGLDYAEQRYYSSALGRFITPDPYAGSVQLGNPDTWNRYAYVNNDPINRTDPHGLFPIAAGFKSSLLYLPDPPQPSQMMSGGPIVFPGEVSSSELYDYDDTGDPILLVEESTENIEIELSVIPTAPNYYTYFPEGYLDANFVIDWENVVGIVQPADLPKYYYLAYGFAEPRTEGGAGTIHHGIPCE